MWYGRAWPFRPGEGGIVDAAGLFNRWLIRFCPVEMTGETYVEPGEPLLDAVTTRLKVPMTGADDAYPCFGDVVCSNGDFEVVAVNG